MTEEEKNEEVKNEEDKKPLGPVYDIPKFETSEFEVGSEDVSDWRWAWRAGAGTVGLWNTVSEYGKLPLSKEELLAQRKKLLHEKNQKRQSRKVSKNPSIWDNVSNKTSKVNSKIDDFADAYVKTLDKVVNNNSVMIGVNKAVYTARKEVKYAVEKAGSAFKITNSSNFPINMAKSLGVKNASKTTSFGAKITESAAKKTAVKLAKKGGKFIAKKIPIACTVVGVGFAVDRFSNGEIIEGVEEIVSGVAANVPVVGTAVSEVLDVDLLVYDEYGIHLLDKDRFLKCDMEYTFRCIKEGKFPTMDGAMDARVNEVIRAEVYKYEKAKKEIEEYKKKVEKSLKEGKFNSNGINMEALIYSVALSSLAEKEKYLLESKQKTLEKGVPLDKDNRDMTAYFSDPEVLESMLLPLTKEQYEMMNRPSNAVELLANNKISSANYLYPVYSDSEISVEGMKHTYGEILIKRDEEDGSVIIGGALDGKLHGSFLCFDKDGELLEVAVYNHGEKMDVENENIEVSWVEDAYGRTVYQTVVDGKKFGWEMAVDADGNAGVAFYNDSNSMYLDVENIRIDMNPSETSRKAMIEEIEKQNMSEQQGRVALHDDLKAQSGGEQQLTGQYALAQAKCDLSLHTAGKRDNSVEVVKSDEKSESKLVAQATPVNGYDFTER